MKPHPLSPTGVWLVIGPGLDPNDYVQLSDQAKDHQKVERWWKRKFREAIDESSRRALSDMAAGSELDPADYDFTPLVVENAIEAMKAGLKRPRVNSKHLAGPPLGMRKIFAMWDKWRKKPSKKQQKNADDIKKSFLHAVQSFWKKHSADFRRGDTYDMDAVRDAFQDKAKIAQSRADMVVQTETTRYYNNAITTLYENAQGVTHYLFAAILDKRTTNWCCDFHKGGRNGLIYKKGDTVTETDQPPCHWNCRSQFLPLSLSNPKHRTLIEDKARQRSSRSPTPLPRGWNS